MIFPKSEKLSGTPKPTVVSVIILYIGFFNTGAYQESIAGFGGVHHCLLPQPKHILIQKAKNGKLQYEVFSEEQKPEDVLHLLGYK